MIEKVQKSCLYIILGKKVTPNYTLKNTLKNINIKNNNKNFKKLDSNIKKSN